MLKRKLAAIILVTTIFFLLVTNPAHAIPTVRLELSSTSVLIGSPFDINVMVDGVTDFDFLGWPDELVGFGFDVDYNNSEFAYNGATVSPLFDDGSADIDNTEVFGLAFPGISGDDILLATLNFTALSEGNFNIGILSDLTDLNEGAFTLVYDYYTQPQIDLTSNINVQVSAVPEPATLLLSGIGLLSAAAMKRRRINRRGR